MAEERAEARAFSGGRGRLSDEEKLDWIRLIRTENVGPITFRELIDYFGNARAALEAVPELRRRGGLQRHGPAHRRDLAMREWEAVEKAGARIIALPETDYPRLLKQIPGPPPILFARGRTELAAGKTVAIVGSRGASAAGRHFAATLARDLGRADIAVASGLARGIDTAAHEAALPTGTIAVVAGGIDMIYPPENAALHEAIALSGLLLTECPPGFAPRGQDFPRRNRIISGVSAGVVVVEAAQKSGSLITARMALEQNREVFAVPGHPLDPRAIGTNKLIQSGAHLVMAAEEIVAELFSGFRRPSRLEEPAESPAWIASVPASGSDEPTSEDRETLLASLSFAPEHPDMLLRMAGLSPRKLAVALLELDLAGRIERHDNACISLRPEPVPAA
ncbi:MULTISPECIES: DNA-processing protein DprA [Rhodomicrobium]|uniref:DNA-processing protein DprA n=1 Tax=Rhodomicrobium TaxID=1068 RepID=UPI000B4BD46F|nr:MULTISPECIES: DNA-processing protein DprA [Rhodomicrobium]